MRADASALDDEAFGFAATHRAYERGAARAGEVACAFVVEHLRARSGHRLLQAPRAAPIACDALHPFARLIASRNLRCLPESAARALAAWASGARDVDLLRRVPAPRDVLALQARRRRCVSLLDAAPEGDPLAFALHDLEHLEKFVDPEHHDGQVGFFASTAAALEHPRWRDVERGLDARWSMDRDHVLADMNGSAAFLFVALKSRLKLAVTRREGSGHLPDARAAAAFDDAREALLDAYALAGRARDAARVFASRHDDPRLGEILVQAFVARA